MVYTVGEIAKKIGVAPSTLRYYDKEGLLPFVERSGGGIRMFRESDAEWLYLIECLKKTGMPIKEIKKFIDLYSEGDKTIESRLSLIDRQLFAVKEQMKELSETLEMLEYKHWYYTVAAEAGTCDVHKTLSDEDKPEFVREFLKKKEARK